jgi:hypothetical protein
LGSSDKLTIAWSIPEHNTLLSKIKESNGKTYTQTISSSAIRKDLYSITCELDETWNAAKATA